MHMRLYFSSSFLGTMCTRDGFGPQTSFKNSAYKSLCNISRSSWCAKIAVRGHNQQLSTYCSYLFCHCQQVGSWGEIFLEKAYMHNQQGRPMIGCSFEWVQSTNGNIPTFSIAKRTGAQFQGVKDICLDKGCLTWRFKHEQKSCERCTRRSFDVCPFHVLMM